VTTTDDELVRAGRIYAQDRAGGGLVNLSLANMVREQRLRGNV
jgi:hypothetical protein